MTVTSSTLRPYLEECGYIGDRLESNYAFGSNSVALAGFIGKPWDARSACLAVVDAVTESRLAAHDCIQLGAPTALVCLGDSLDWWQLSIDGPREPKRIRAAEVQGFFRLHGEQLRPENIYAAKLRRPTKIQGQMEFVDIGLMPALERRAGESLSRLVSQAILTLMDDLGEKVRSKADAEGVFKSVFWLLAAKLLREKRVQGFKSLDLTNTDQVFAVVGQHYRDARDYPPGDKTWKPAIARIAGSIANWGNLGNITSESLAYLYETALIDGPTQAKPKGSTDPVHDVRKILGIHSTPSMLVDHMLSQIWPLVDPDKLADQRVFEAVEKHFQVTSYVDLVRTASPVVDQSAIAMRERSVADLRETMERLATFQVELTQREAERREKTQVAMDEAHRLRTDALDKEFRERQAGLDRQKQTAEEDVAKERKALQDRVAQFETREAKYMRRELLKEIRAVLAEAEKTTLSEPTGKKRKPVHFAVWGLLAASAALGIVMGCRAFTAPEADWHFLAPMSAGFATFVLTMIYYLKWNDRWFREHADAEFGAKRYKADILRASWVAELAQEWVKEGKGDLSPDLIASYTRNLFRDVGPSRVSEHPMDHLTAIMKRATEFEFGRGIFSVRGYKPDGKTKTD